MKYTKVIYVSIAVVAVVAVVVLIKISQRETASETVKQSPNISEEKGERSLPITTADSEQALATDTPVSEIKKGLSKRELNDDIPTQERGQDHPTIGVAAFMGSVSKGGAILTGGWAMPNGSHMFLLVSPKMRPDIGSDVVEISGEFFGVSPDRLSEPGWDELLKENDSGIHLNGATYDADQLREFRRQYDSEIKNVLSSPQIVARSGDNAILQIGGETDAITLSVIATYNEASGEIELATSTAVY